jgi:copper(I)-binding protein
MRKILAAALIGAAAATAALAGDRTLAILDPFARATPGMAKNGAAYLAVSNAGSEADRLLGARSGVAARVELHTHANDNGVMRMRPLDGGIEVPAGGTAALAPGGDHIMLMDLKAPLAEGDSFPLTLVFERAGEITVDVKVKGIAAHGDKHR